MAEGWALPPYFGALCPPWKFPKSYGKRRIAFPRLGVGHGPACNRIPSKAPNIEARQITGIDLPIPACIPVHSCFPGAFTLPDNHKNKDPLWIFSTMGKMSPPTGRVPPRRRPGRDERIARTPPANPAFNRLPSDGSAPRKNPEALVRVLLCIHTRPVYRGKISESESRREFIQWSNCY